MKIPFKRQPFPQIWVRVSKGSLEFYLLQQHLCETAFLALSNMVTKYRCSLMMQSE